MAFLGPDDQEELRRIFAGLTHDVRVELVSDDLDLRLLIDEVTEPAAGRIHVEKRASGDMAPPVASGGGAAPWMTLSSDLLKGKVLFLGTPVGYEMATLVGGLATVGGAMGQTFVSEAAQAKLDALEKDVRLEVFSTPG